MLFRSVAMLIVFTMLQRSVGLVRNVWFCRILEDDELGRWSLAYNFLLLAAPLIVLGLPGSFGRYVERYRQRGQLRPFLRRTAIVCLIAAAACYFGIHLCADTVALLVFGDASRVDLVRILGTTLILVTFFNFLVELLMSLRLIRFASTMQLASSLGFATFGILLLSWTPLREEAVMLAYAGGVLVAAVIGMAVVVWYWRSLPPDAAQSLPQGGGAGQGQGVAGGQKPAVPMGGSITQLSGFQHAHTPAPTQQGVGASQPHHACAHHDHIKASLHSVAPLGHTTHPKARSPMLSVLHPVRPRAPLAAVLLLGACASPIWKIGRAHA